jgi:hypothetical protein
MVVKKSGITQMESRNSIWRYSANHDYGVDVYGTTSKKTKWSESEATLWMNCNN